MLHVSEPLSEFLTLYPKAHDKAMQQLRKDFQKIFNQEYGIAKDRICMFKELAPLLQKKKWGLDKKTCLRILEAVLEGDIERAKADASGINKRGDMRQSFSPTTWTASIYSALKAISPWESDADSTMSDLVRHATQAAMQVSDSLFLSQLEQDVERYAKSIPRFKDWADKAKQKAFGHLEVSIMRTLKRLTPVVHRIQEDECAQRIKCEYAKKAEEEQDKLRVDLIKQINELSAQTISSCVSKLCLVVQADVVARI